MPETPHFGWETPAGADPVDIAADLLSLAEEIEDDLHELPVSELGAVAEDSGKIIVVSNTGAPTYRALSGDATLNNLGALAIANQAVSTAKMALLAVTEAILGNESVATAKIKLLAVTAAKLANEAVETAKIANLAVTEGKIANLAVGTAKIGELAVTALKIAAEAVTTAKIQNLAVTEAKLANEAVGTGKIKARAVTGPKIHAAGTVSSAGAKVSGSGFTCEREKVGHYIITFSVEMTQNPTAWMLPITAGAQVTYQLISKSKKELYFATWDSGTSISLDVEFTFGALQDA